MYKMNYYWFNRQEILPKAKEKYSKEKVAKYYLKNKEAIKEDFLCFLNIKNEKNEYFFFYSLI